MSEAVHVVECDAYREEFGHGCICEWLRAAEKRAAVPTGVWEEQSYDAGYEAGREAITDEDRQNMHVLRQQGARDERKRIRDGVLAYYAVAPKAAEPILRIIDMERHDDER